MLNVPTRTDDACVPERIGSEWLQLSPVRRAASESLLRAGAAAKAAASARLARTADSFATGETKGDARGDDIPAKVRNFSRNGARIAGFDGATRRKGPPDLSALVPLSDYL